MWIEVVGSIRIEALKAPPAADIPLCSHCKCLSHWQETVDSALQSSGSTRIIHDPDDNRRYCRGPPTLAGATTDSCGYTSGEPLAWFWYANVQDLWTHNVRASLT